LVWIIYLKLKKTFLITTKFKFFWKIKLLSLNLLKLKQKKMNIFLDDIRYPNISHNDNKGLGSEFSAINKWIIVRDYFEFIELINNSFDDIKLVSFDHDLACYKDGKEWTGKDAANYLINYCLDNNKKFPSWYVHSDNTAGKKNIISSIINYLKVVEGINTLNFKYFHNGILNGIPV